MNYTDMLPYVLPWAVRCPNMVATQQVRLAVMEFFKRTHAWQQTFNLTTVANQQTYTVPLTSDQEGLKVKKVFVDSDKYTPANEDVNLELQSCMSDQAIYWVPDTVASTPFQFNVSPTPLDDGVPIVVRVSMKPSESATSFPDFFATQYREALAAGALAKILSMPEKDWTDKEMAAQKLGMFELEIARAAARAERGYGAKRQRTRAAWY